MTDELDPLLRELAGLPGAPVRIEQTAATYTQDARNGVLIGRDSPPITGDPPVFRLLLPVEEGGDSSRDRTGRELVNSVVGIGRDSTEAQQAVAAGILHSTDLPQGSPAAVAAQRFAALPPAARHEWLMEHVEALRSGRLSLAQLP